MRRTNEKEKKKTDSTKSEKRESQDRESGRKKFYELKNSN